MPHINRVRVNNVRYNFGTQFYDDFIMRFDCKNVLYDLANGGGKSVLLLLLLQNLIPNCTLDDKQPVEKLFRGEGGSTVIHSLIEWKLDDYLVKDDYRYMLTGFCARKAKDDENQNAAGDAAAIEYFNYVIFYRHYNDNDIVNLPLSDGKERITWPGLKNYLRNLSRKDYQLQVHLFERKGEYQRFISRYGLYESEWEIIRGINKTEGHVRTYFESHYRTTRKVVEDLLIEEIIQKAFMARTSERAENGDNMSLMADTLYQIKDQLAELTRKKAEIGQYDRQQEVMHSLGERIRTLDVMYGEEMTLRMDIARAWQTVLARQKNRTADLAAARREQELAKGHMEDYARKLETVKIQSSKEQLAYLEKEAADCSEKLEKLQLEQAVSRDDLNLRESMNDYLEYLEEQQKYQAVENTIRHSTDGQKEQLAQLRAYAKAWQKRCQKRMTVLDDRIVQGRKEMENLQQKLDELASSEREDDRMLAVLEHQSQENREKEQMYLKDFARLREASGLLVIEEVDKELLSQKKKLEAKEAELMQLMEDAKAAEAEKNEQQLQEARNTQMLGHIRTLIREGNEFMAAWQREYEQIAKLLQVYQVTEAGLLKEHLFARYRKLVCDIEERQRQEAALKEKIHQLEDGGMMRIPADVQDFMDYIRTCHGITCVYGAQYLQETNDAERRALLVRMPFLPYTVILKDGFAKVAADELLKEKDFGEHVIPVISLETVLSEEEPVEKSRLLFAGKGSSFYLDENMRHKVCAQSREQLTELQRVIARMEDQQQTYEKDMESVSSFLLVYDSKKEENRQALRENQKKELALLEKQKLIKDRIQQLDGQLSGDAVSIEEAGKQAETAKEQYAVLESLRDVNTALTETKHLIEEVRQKYGKLAAKKQEEEQTATLMRTKMQEQSEVCEHTVSEKDLLIKDWEDNWKLYAVETDGQQLLGEQPSEGQVSEDLTDDALRAAFYGIRDAYEKEHMDLDDKKQLMESYARSMERLTKSIADRNLQMARMENLRADGQIYQTAAENIRQIRQDLENMAQQADNMRQQLTAIEADKNRLYGSVAQAVNVIEEKYGAYKEVALNDQSYESYVENMRQLYENTSAEYRSLTGRIERLTKELYALEGIRHDVERLMKLCHVQENLTTETLDEQIGLKRRYEELLRRYEQMQSRYFAKRDAFEKDKAKAVSELHQLGAEGLSAELREHLSLPENAEAAGRVMQEIEETIALIRIEKERVGKNMEDLVSIKDSFESQCLQICQNIRMELDKLPKMSAIVMDNEQIQMVGLTIPYVKENFYKEKMSAYIDDIVNQSDTLGTQEEKMRYIRQQLAWKRLFSVIVTDMNAIRLTLYKRERIASQSRYLKYEEAVGSTGQSQGIYIQFLIAVIHYISAIHAGAAAGEHLRKVLFIDNPFGAAKDIYIWEPIFALLKTNDVQLIVPARGATPAITGKFDVNYVLGQKLMNHRQQTIVVDYHSNVKIDEMEYVKINYEQEVFDFV